MSTATAEIVRLCEALPEDKRMEVMDFARFLLGRVESPDDLERERRLADPTPRPKLEAFLRESAAEGAQTEALNRLQGSSAGMGLSDELLRTRAEERARG